MEKNGVSFAGDIKAEIMAIDGLEEMMSITEAKSTHTSECGGLFTIYCC